MTALRIIPARAGPTWLISPMRRFSQDHPRSCGANSVDDAVGHFVSGSSPLVRGQLHHILLVFLPVRIIPARAGPTQMIGGRDG